MIAVGTPETHPLIARLAAEGRLNLPEGDGFLLQTAEANGAEILAAAGETPRGAFYAAGKALWSWRWNAR